MSDQNNKEYKINIDPRILELLGPSLYTNIYYVLAELIANGYDAGAKNVYIIQKENAIIVEDDGVGMSYDQGDIGKYLNVAAETRTTPNDELSKVGNRKRMGRKGVGKLAALSVSENVLVMTLKEGDQSGFILSRHVGADHNLKAIPNEEIKFEKIKSDGTSIVMTNPQYGLHKTAKAIRNNLLKIFPLVSEDFKIHVETANGSITVDGYDKDIISGLGALILLGEEFFGLSENFKSNLQNEELVKNEILKKKEKIVLSVKLLDKEKKEVEVNIEIKGWIGSYQSTRNRKNDENDFPDNFISLLSNKKLGEYNILPAVGKNRLTEVYIVGQLHVDIFEETSLPDMALSNRQGYKSDDPRYITVLSYVRDKLLPEVIEMRSAWAAQSKVEKDAAKEEAKKKAEEQLKQGVEEFKKTASEQAAEKIAQSQGTEINKETQDIIRNEMNAALPLIGLKKKIDSEKKRVLISQTRKDKALADVIYKMLSFNGAPDEDIIYTNCDSEGCWVPNRMDVFDYLKTFFVDSVSDSKMSVLYVTSEDMSKSWGAVAEVGAGWITQSSHDIFNIKNHTPQSPLNIGAEWQNSEKNGDKIIMDHLEADKFVVKIMHIAKDLGYAFKSKEENQIELKRYADIK